jgi:hypothetical protein
VEFKPFAVSVGFEDVRRFMTLGEAFVIFDVPCSALRERLRVYRWFVKSSRSVGKIFFDMVLLTLF